MRYRFKDHCFFHLPIHDEHMVQMHYVICPVWEIIGIFPKERRVETNKLGTYVFTELEFEIFMREFNELGNF